MLIDNMSFLKNLRVPSKPQERSGDSRTIRMIGGLMIKQCPCFDAKTEYADLKPLAIERPE